MARRPLLEWWKKFPTAKKREKKLNSFNIRTLEANKYSSWWIFFISDYTALVDSCKRPKAIFLDMMMSHHLTPPPTSNLIGLKGADDHQQRQQPCQAADLLPPKLAKWINRGLLAE